MNDFKTLSDAFAELERRADLASANLQAEPPLTPAAKHRTRPLLLAASVVGVLAVAAGGTLAARNLGGHSQAGSPPQSSAATRPTAHVTQGFAIPKTPEELAQRFRVVLGDTATFTVTDTGAAATVKLPSRVTVRLPNNHVATESVPTEVPVRGLPNGAAIVGKLTASGVTGGFDLQIYRGTAGEKAFCDDPDRARCTISRLADGASLAVGHEPLPGSSNGVTLEVNLVRPDGAVFLMHVSNEASPKGASDVLAAHPPLTADQMVAIVTSDRW